MKQDGEGKKQLLSQYQKKTLTASSINTTRETVTVKKVLDDNTLLLSKDGKEFKGYLQKNCPGTSIYRNKVSEGMRNLVEGKQIQVEYNKNKISQYGQTAIYAFIGGKSLQSYLIRKGIEQLTDVCSGNKYLNIVKKTDDKVNMEEHKIIKGITGEVDKNASAIEGTAKEQAKNSWGHLEKGIQRKFDESKRTIHLP